MAELPDEGHLEARSAAAASALRDLCRGRRDDWLLWCIAPHLVMRLSGWGEDTRSWVGGVRNVARARSLRRGPEVLVADRVSMFSTSVQNRRVLAPIHEHLVAAGRSSRAAAWPRLPARSILSAQRYARGLASSLRTSLVGVGLRYPDGASEEVLQAALVRERTVGLLQRLGAEVVVVASQHNAASRAVISAARVVGLPTVYVPHAPLADLPWYEDLPCTRSLLRGQAEVDHYLGLGAHASTLRVVGDPSLAVWPPPPAPRRRTVVFATSPDDGRGRLGAAIEVVAQAGLDAVELAPHPRQDRGDLQRACPSSWTMNPLPSTYARLAAAGALSVVQYGSGLGLEALAMGLPVIDLSNPGRPPAYPYIRPPCVTTAASSEEVHAAVAHAKASTGEEAARVRHALSWVATGGPEAAQLAAEEILRCAHITDPRELGLEGWA